MSRDYAFTLARLERLEAIAGTLRAHARDLYELGYAPAGRGLEPSRNTGPPAGVENVGDARARAVWAGLVLAAAEADQLLGDVKIRALNLLSEGPPRPGPSRGSTIRPEDLEAELERQRLRGGPARLVPQPEHPGSSPGPARKRKGRRK